MKNHAAKNPVPVGLPLLVGLCLTTGFCSGATVARLPSLGGPVLEAKALNRAGQIAGFSTLSSGEQHGFLNSAGVTYNLGTLGGVTSAAFGLNDAGWVVGESEIESGQETHAFLFAGATLIDLGTLGGTFSAAAAVNNRGQVVGVASLPGDGESHAFLYDTNGVLRDLGTLSQGYSFARDINNRGQVVGDSTDLSGNTVAFLWQDGVMTGLTLGGTAFGYAINDAGQVVGESLGDTGEYHAFLHSEGRVIDLGTLGGTYSVASTLNEAGQVIGDSTTEGDREIHGFICTGGALTDLGTLGGPYSSAHAINNLGQVVGDSTDPDRNSIAFLWQNGVMYDLNRVLPPNSGWVLETAWYINDVGQIVGTGYFQGSYAWYLLTLGQANHPPVAAAGADQSVECGKVVRLDGSGSTDPDGDTLAYEWREGETKLATEVQASVTLGTGVHNLTLTVTDPSGASSDDTVVVTVNDTAPPLIICPAARTASPSANCQASVPDFLVGLIIQDNCTPAQDLVKTQDPTAGTLVGAGSHTITLTVTDAAGNSSSCTTTFIVADSTPPRFACPAARTVSPGANCQAPVPDFLADLVTRDNCTPAERLVKTQAPTAGTLVGTGTHAVTIRVTDLAGNTTACITTLTVADTTAPTIRSASVTPADLTPANHRMVPVTVSIVAVDNCDPAPTCSIVSIVSSDPVTSQGDKTSPDWEITGPLTADLRAERSKGNVPRIYTLKVACTDASGNTTETTLTVGVHADGAQAAAASSKIKKVKVKK